MRCGTIVTPIVDVWCGTTAPALEAMGIPIYATSNLQYDSITSAPIAWMSSSDIGWVMSTHRPRGTFTAVQLLLHSGTGWSAAAYITAADT